MDTNEYLGLFLEESRENLQVLNEGLLSLEQDPENEMALNEIFRAAHTLKGMAATMGFEQITELTHKMENVLGKLRDKELEFSRFISDLLFKCVDALENMVEGISTGNQNEFVIDGLVASLKNLEEGQGQAVEETSQYTVKDELNEYENNLILKGQEQNFHTYKVVVEVSPQCVMKAVRAFMVFKNLEELGEIIKSVPAVQDLEDEKFDREFTLYLLTKENENKIRNAVDKISEISLKQLAEVKIQKEANLPKEKKKTVNQVDSWDKTKIKTMQTVRVDITKLDNLMNLVGELVINKTRLEQIMKTGQVTSLGETVEQIERITSDLQNVVMKVRMVPIEQVFNRFPRMVRDFSKELEKEVELVLEGQETELDRTVIDEISDPLVHLIRNSLDHGLEKPEERLAQGKSRVGTLKLIARQEGNSVLIIVEDDGQGINIEKVKTKAVENGMVTIKELEQMSEKEILDFIFAPGFSTAQQVTDISGRGVGLDVVRAKINSLNGNVFLESQPGIGTKFTIKLPLTLAIIQALLVKVEEEVYAIPLANIDETTLIEEDVIKNVQGQEVMVLRGKVLPLIRLSKVLEVPCTGKCGEELYVVVVRKGEEQIGLVVDELIGQQEIVISSLGKLFSNLPGIAGAAILGDGKVSLILDIGTLF